MKKLLVVAIAVLASCTPIPPNGVSHARFVRATDEPVIRAGFAAGVVASDEQVTFPVSDGSLLVGLGSAYDASVVAHDGLAHYEGLFRLTPRFGLLHGAGVGFPRFGRTNMFAFSGSVGLFGQLGSSFFASASYSPLLWVEPGERSSPWDFHAVNMEAGYAFGHEVQVAPTLLVSYVRYVDMNFDPPLQAVLSVSFQVGSGVAKTSEADASGVK